ncbi:hypothetical protein CFN78_08630 [Amycolatopsis antarctica]|uniref:Carrier domain-containing protein n=1 Tax=Amycolatopsis antarctica TaxID=1854586 RepID=A0A263D6C2_9PSEU|nr:non-ribosomal peptide synthetase [Amycolatopsis antarctica]OZM73588.1 hypothetical protein CFN78_08630 [Amycolatopsis antarctica]
MTTSRDGRADRLPEHLREKLRERLRGGTSTAETERAEPAGIPVVPRDGELPLSFSQQRLWFMHEFEPESVEYNSCFGLRLTGELDVTAFRTAIEGVVARHESLRTTFDSVEGRGVQVIHDRVEVPLRLVDLAGTAEDARRVEVDRLAAEEVATPFDLRTGPLLRVLLLRLSTGEHVCVLSLHHIVHDGWSLAVFVKQLRSGYSAAVRGLPEDTAPARLQYADFAVWQRRRLAGPVLDEQLAYWREQLTGVPALELPTDRPRPAVRSAAGAVHILDVPAEVATGLRALARECGGTLFMTLVAAVQALLSRYSGRSDVAVATPVSGRGHPELEELIGFFLNTLVLRSEVDSEGSFRQLLASVRETVLGAFAREEVPFERVVEVVAPERDTSRLPLAQALVVLQNAPSEELELDGLRIGEFRLPQASSGFDVVFGFEEKPDGTLWTAVEYSTDLFDADTVHRLSAHLVALLRAVVAEPDAPLATRPLLTGPERARLTGEWAHPAVELPPERCVHELVARRAAERPDAPAVTSGADTVTYRDLDERANRLARHLLAWGAGPGTLVALSFDRTAELVVATLAVLKAGAAYVPLDPGYPAERRDHILADTGAPLVLTQADLLPDFAGASAEVLAVSAEAAAIDALPSTPPEVTVSPGDLAYVIYTSGSTGRPKGVLLEHRGLVDMVTAAVGRFDLGPGTVVPALASISFDGAVWETFTALVSGGTLSLGTGGAGMSELDLDAHLAGARRALVSLPPAALAAIDPATLPEGSVVLAVGDRCPVDLHRTWAPRHRFVNGYGPTEVTIGATMFEGTVADWAPRVPVGRPIANARVYIVDAHLRPVPIGVAGELVVGGSGVARGYLNQPGLTARRFVADPFSTEPGARLYRTGDLAAWRADGTLDFLGRADTQVKIKGYRIEPGEVEAVLLGRPGIAEALVVARQDAGREHLVAYVVAGAGAAEPDGVELRAAVAGELPPYMVPSAVVCLDAFPLTGNGKVDHRVLPAPAVDRSDREFTAPSGPVEPVLAGIWQDVLGVGPVGARDNFFELGGDSILSIQLVSRCRAAGLRFTSKDLFRNQTVAELAAVLVVAEDEQAADTGPVTGEVPLSPVQSWFFANAGASPHHFNQSVLLELAPDADPAAVRAALAVLVERHDALRMRFEPVDGHWRQENPGEAAGRWAFDTYDLSGLPAVDRDRTVDELVRRAQAGLRLTDGPLLRAVLIECAGRPPRLFLTVHHLVVDGVSWRILLADLEQAYACLAAGEPIALPARTSSFRDWSRRMREHAVGGGFDGELDYWLEVAGADRTRLPVRGPGANTTGSTDRVTVRLDASGTETLLRTVPGRYRTRVDDVLLTALGRALSRWTGRADVLVDVEGHGREELFDELDLTRTVGWFTSIYPVAPGVRADQSWTDALRTVKRRLRELPNRGIGHGALRYLGSADESAQRLAESASAEISFNYLGQFDGSTDPANGLLRAQLPHGGADHAPDGPRSHLVDIVAAVESGCLELTWTYSAAVQERGEIERVAGAMMADLRELCGGG